MGKDLKKILNEMDLEGDGSSKEKKVKKVIPMMLKSKAIIKEKADKQSLVGRMEEEEKKKKRIRKKAKKDDKTGKEDDANEKMKAIKQAILFKTFNSDLKLQGSELFNLFEEKDKNKNTKSGKKRKDKRKNILRKKAWSKPNLNINSNNIFSNKFFKEYVEKSRSSKLPEKDLNLESLKDSLRKVEDVHKKLDEKKRKKKNQGVTNKEKTKASHTELNRYKKILNFQPFLNNPLETIKTHILNSQQAAHSTLKK